MQVHMRVTLAEIDAMEWDQYRYRVQLLEELLGGGDEWESETRTDPFTST